MSKVYYSFIDDTLTCVDFSNLNCKKRVDYINSINNLDRKKQSYFVWKLLEYVTKDSNYEFQLHDSGQWVEKNDRIYFSISHSGNLIAVALSDKSIGVDVEKCNEKILRIKRRFDCKNIKELNEIQNLTYCWTKEESKFKCGKAGAFKYSIVNKDGDEFVITACYCDNDVTFENVDCKSLNF